MTQTWLAIVFDRFFAFTLPRDVPNKATTYGSLYANIMTQAVRTPRTKIESAAPMRAEDKPAGTLAHECPFPRCNKSFSKKYNLKAHLRLHTGEQPFSCPRPDCNKRFKWRSSLSSHSVWHTRQEAANSQAKPDESTVSAMSALSSASSSLSTMHGSHGGDDSALLSGETSESCTAASPSTNSATSDAKGMHRMQALSVQGGTQASASCKPGKTSASNKACEKRRKRQRTVSSSVTTPVADTLPSATRPMKRPRAAIAEPDATDRGLTILLEEPSVTNDTAQYTAQSSVPGGFDYVDDLPASPVHSIDDVGVLELDDILTSSDVSPMGLEGAAALDVHPLDVRFGPLDFDSMVELENDGLDGVFPL